MSTELDALRKKAQEGDAESLYQLGLAHREGEGAPQDDTEAARWFAAAADQGHASALFRLAMMTGAGDGVPADDDEARRLLGRAAEAGHPLALETLEQLAQFDEAAQRKLQEVRNKFR